MRFTSIAVIIVLLSTSTCSATTTTVAVEESDTSTSIITTTTTTKRIFPSHQLRGKKFIVNKQLYNTYRQSRKLIISDETKTLLLGPPSCTNQYPTEIDISLGFFGNSILFFNDSPRIIQQMMIDNTVSAIQQTCVKGGASFLTLYDLGCSMGKTWLPNNIIQVNNDNGKCTEINRPRTIKETFKENNFDYIILNDQTQYPARSTTVDESKYVIENLFGPIWPNSFHDSTSTSTTKKAIPIIVLTPAYRYPVMQYTMDLGDFNQFTDLLIDGVTEYQKVFIDKLNIKDARIAPVGEGYRYIKNSNELLFNKLYNKDNYHPSIYGTYLQSLIIYMTILNDTNKDQLPPTTFNKDWFDNVRGINHEDYPSIDEAKELYNAALAVMNRSETTGSTSGSTSGSTDTTNDKDDTDDSPPDTDTDSSTDDATVTDPDPDGDDKTDNNEGDDKTDSKDDDKIGTSNDDDKDTDNTDTTSGYTSDSDANDDDNDDDTEDNATSTKGKEKETKTAKRVDYNTNTNTSSSSSSTSASSSASDIPSITPSKDDAATASDIPSSKPSGVLVIDQDKDKEDN